MLIEDESTGEGPRFSIEGQPTSPLPTSSATALRPLEYEEEYPIDIRRLSKTREDSSGKGIELAEITFGVHSSGPAYVPPPPEMNKLLDEDESITKL